MSYQNQAGIGGNANQVTGGVNITGGNISGGHVNLGEQGDVINNVGGDFIKGGTGGHVNKSGSGGDVFYCGKGGAGGDNHNGGFAGTGGPAKGDNIITYGSK